MKLFDSDDIKAAVIAGGFLAVLLVAMLVFAYGLSWIITCGVVYLITLCFGWDFSWLMATGVWAAAFLIRALFGKRKKD